MIDVDSSITNTTSAYGLQGSSVVVMPVVVLVIVVVVVAVVVVSVVVVVAVVVVFVVVVVVVVVGVVVVSGWQAVKLAIWVKIFSAAACCPKRPPTSQCRGSTSLGVLAIFLYR